MLEVIDRDVYVRIEADLLVIGDSIMTDRHHATGGDYKPDDPQNKIGGIIPAFPLSGWLRHGIERVVQAAGGTACHPGTANANFDREAVYERDLAAGYHEKGACIEDTPTEGGCVVFDLFGGFNSQPGKLMRRPIKFSPVRGSVEYRRGEAEGHYRRLNRNVVSRNEADGRKPLRHTRVDAVANLDGCWHLSFRELKPEFVGAVIEAIEFLDANQTEFMHQLGGARNFGAGIVDCGVINPLYDDHEFRRVFDRGKDPNEAMRTKDSWWQDEYLPRFITAFNERVAEGP